MTRNTTEKEKETIKTVNNATEVQHTLHIEQHQSKELSQKTKRYTNGHTNNYCCLLKATISVIAVD